jgi:hypothetical protein
MELQGTGYFEEGLLESRSRIQAEVEEWLRPSWFLKAGAYSDGLVREEENPSSHLRPSEIYLEGRSPRADLRLGYSTVACGLLEEIQPADIVNPLNLARFFMETRSKARLPVPLTLLKVYMPHELTVEAIWVPVPRSSTFDPAGQGSSPFRPALPPAFSGVDLPESDVAHTVDHTEYGARLTGTILQTDWGLSVFRDRVDQDFYTLSAPANGIEPGAFALRAELHVRQRPRMHMAARLY